MSSTAYDIRANLHRPPDVDQLAAEIRRLHTGGLMPRDIAAALRLAPDAVVTMLWGDQHADITERRCLEPGT